MTASKTTSITREIRRRVDSLGWDQLNEQLDNMGHAMTPVLLEGEE